MGSSSSTSAPIGRSLLGGRYELLHELASGGMATVYVARARGAAGFERMVAVKCCHKHLRSDDEFARMFLDEARLVSEIHHSNVVSTLDFGEDPEHSLYIVMEFVDGFSLQQVLRAAKHRGTPMPPSVALKVVIDALEGLHAAHRQRDRKGNPLRIVHRDVSPQNILVGIDGVARIMDFGIARAEGRSAHTESGTIKGKLAYMPPEQHGLLADGPQEVTLRADLYSAGVVLWEALSGDKLFQRETDALTVRAAIKGEVPALAARVTGVTEAIDAAIARALQRDPEQRFASAEEFIVALESSGLRAASSREVGAWVRSLLAAHIEARHNLLRKLAAHPSDPAPAPDARAALASPSADDSSGARSPLDERSSSMLADREAPTPQVMAPRHVEQHVEQAEIAPNAPPFRPSLAPARAGASARRARRWSVGVGVVTALVGASALAAVVSFVAARSPQVRPPSLEPSPDSSSPHPPSAPRVPRSSIAEGQAPATTARPPDAELATVRAAREAAARAGSSSGAASPTLPALDASSHGLPRRAPAARPSRPPRTHPFRPRFL